MTWRALFERASTYSVTEADIRNALRTRRDE